MLPLFFNEVCSILTDTPSMVDGEQLAALTTVATNLSCCFYAPGNSYAPGKFSQEQGTESYILVFPGDASSYAVKGRYALVSGSQYLIDAVQVHKLPSGIVDNTECRITQRLNA